MADCTLKPIQNPIAAHDRPVWHVSEWFSNGTMDFCNCYHHKLSGVLGTHSSEFYELNIVVNGDAEHWINNTCCRAETGSVYIIPPGTAHGYRAEDAVIFHVLLRYEFFEQYERELRALPGYAMLFEVLPYLINQGNSSVPFVLSYEQYLCIQPIVRQLIESRESPYRGKGVMNNAAILFLISCLSSFAENLKVGKQYKIENPNTLAISKSMEYIRMNYGIRMTVEELAEQACMSRSSYMRNFSTIAGCSPMQFLQRCRLAQARKLLCYTSMPLTSLALECGFYDTSHFIRTFVKSEGISPSDYRNLYFHNAIYPACTICRMPENRFSET